MLQEDTCHPQVAGFVLAGGLSTRMGTEKALIPLAGRPLIAWTLDALRSAGLKVAIAGARQDLSSFARVIHDDGMGPLSGIGAALAASEEEWAVFVPVDMPLVPASLLTAMVDHARVSGAAVTVPSVCGFAVTFPAVVHRKAEKALRAALEEGRRGCFAAFQAATQFEGGMQILPLELLVQAGSVAHPGGMPVALWLSNLNSREDLQHAEKLLSASHRVS